MTCVTNMTNPPQRNLTLIFLWKNITTCVTNGIIPKPKKTLNICSENKHIIIKTMTCFTNMTKQLPWKDLCHKCDESYAKKSDLNFPIKKYHITMHTTYVTNVQIQRQKKSLNIHYEYKLIIIKTTACVTILSHKANPAD